MKTVQSRPEKEANENELDEEAKKCEHRVFGHKNVYANLFDFIFASSAFSL